jgi:pimeloyl-ACP methyl ester carboxylesterase
MRIQLERAVAGSYAPTRIVLLPAAYTGPEDFIREGFLRCTRERELAIDLAFAEVSLQHVSDRTILRRLRHEAILPARAVGCASVWICGISLGGFLALAYAERYPTEVDGLCLLAPYLGNRIVTGEIERADGLLAWEPGELAADDDERRIWRYVKTHERPPALYLGFGSEDRFAASHRMMAAALAPEAVDERPGAHDWPVWRELWENFLDHRLRGA